MDVGVDEARQRRRVGEVPRPGVGRARHGRIGADGGDPAVLDQERLRRQGRRTGAIDELADGDTQCVHEPEG